MLEVAVVTRWPPSEVERLSWDDLLAVQEIITEMYRRR